MADLAPQPFTTFGDLLRHLRQRARLTQEELGIAVGYSRAHVARLENNQRAPDVSAVRARFIEALHLPAGAEVAQRLLELAALAREVTPHDMPGDESFEIAPTQTQRAHPIPNNLSERLTTFIGRTRELQELERLLLTARLLTLTGTGGTGKTRLALELAARTMHREVSPQTDADAGAYADGIWVAELAKVADPTVLPQMLLALLGLHEDVKRSALATLTEGLRDKHLLLILDNCEHLIEACAHMVEMVLRGSQGVRILTTSRETLGIDGELTWRVPSLQTPALKASLGLLELADYEAVRLFVDRAMLVVPGFELSSTNAAAVQQICARLEGIPLAIELAAAQLKVMSVEEIAARLNDHLRLLKGGSRTALPRQQTLRAAIDWSYQLLTEPERKVLQRLSVFLGDWTLEAAEHVCQGEDENIVRLLTRLLDKSLVGMRQHEGVTRYYLLETIRQYAAEKLDEAGERSVVRDRHFDYFLSLAERERALSYGAPSVDQVHLFQRGGRNLDNVRRAWEWAEETGKIEKGLRLIMDMAWFFVLRAGQKEVITRLQTLLKHPSAAHNTQAEALAYLYMARFQIRQSESELSRASLEMAEAITFAPDDPDIRAEILSMKAQWAQELGDYALARSYLDQWRAFVLAHHPLGKDPEQFALVAASLYGLQLWHEGEYVQAKASFLPPYEWNLKTGNKINATALARHIGYVLLYSGEVAEAAGWFRESLTGNFALGDMQAVAACLAACGAYALAQEVPHAAACLFGATEKLQALLNTPVWSLDARQVQRNVATLRKQLAPAELESNWLAGRAMTLDQAVEYALSCCMNEPK